MATTEGITLGNLESIIQNKIGLLKLGFSLCDPDKNNAPWGALFVNYL